MESDAGVAPYAAGKQPLSMPQSLSIGPPVHEYLDAMEAKQRLMDEAWDADVAQRKGMMVEVHALEARWKQLSKENRALKRYRKDFQLYELPQLLTIRETFTEEGIREAIATNLDLLRECEAITAKNQAVAALEQKELLEFLPAAAPTGE